MNFYSMNFSDTQNLSIDAFWLLHGNISRIKAENKLHEYSYPKEFADKNDCRVTIDKLEKEWGDPYGSNKKAKRNSNERDSNATARLKALSKGF